MPQPAVLRAHPFRVPVIAAVALCVIAVVGLSSCGAGGERDDDAAATGSGHPKTVDNALGSTKVPAEPERIVTLDPSFTDAVVALGGDVVGHATFFSEQEALPGYLDDVAGGQNPQNVGLVTEPSLEKIAALNPDLILSAKVRHADLAKKLSKIAPTVMSETTGPTWKENTLLVGKAI